jgi:hypothetical protein
VSDEYRDVLLRWAAEQLPAELSAQKIVNVRLDYETEKRWSEYTAENSHFDVYVTYLDAAGTEQVHLLPGEEDGITRSLSVLLSELFRVADLTGSELREGAAEVERRRRAAARWKAEATKGATMALFYRGKQVTGWEPYNNRGITSRGYSGVVDEIQICNDEGRVTSIPIGGTGGELAGPAGTSFAVSWGC